MNFIFVTSCKFSIILMLITGLYQPILCLADRFFIRINKDFIIIIIIIIIILFVLQMKKVKSKSSLFLEAWHSPSLSKYKHMIEFWTRNKEFNGEYVNHDKSTLNLVLIYRLDDQILFTWHLKITFAQDDETSPKKTDLSFRKKILKS